MSRSRVVVAGRRTDASELCTLVAVCEVGGTWTLYPHGDGRLGVRQAIPALEPARGYHETCRFAANL
ncbi:MAG: hypothetical protein ACT4NY_32545 [Pseudonocardiales bacterium]